jgi:PIN domain nuclease of toxin-antitoxin system
VRLLLDTHILLWASGWSTGPPGVDPMPAEAARLIDDTDNELVFSVASLWEMAIKSAKGLAGFSVDVSALRRSLLDNAYRELTVAGEHAIAVARLPTHHKDPFDRLLIAQAQVEGFTLLTADETMARYGPVVRRV